jgi:hypothetical protein
MITMTMTMTIQTTTATTDPAMIPIELSGDEVGLI